MATKQDQDWSFGLRSSGGGYLTAESFGDKLVAVSQAMKKKQIWFLEQSEGDNVFIRSHQGKYLTIDGDGKFMLGPDAGEEAALVIEAQTDGRWAIKSAKYGWYAGGTGENLSAFVKEITEEKLWTVNLAMHPMVTIRNIKRGAYLHLDPKSQTVTGDELIPWGDDAVLSITFFDDKGAYGIQNCEGNFLASNGECKAQPDESCMFILEFHGGVVSFKSAQTGKYLTCLGASGLAKATKAAVGQDEQFQLENSYPQITLRAANNLLVSTKQGIEIAASMGDSTTDQEIFQLEPLGGSTFNIKTNAEKYWTTNESGALIAESTTKDAGSAFDVEFHGNQIAIKASNGKYMTQLMNKYCKANADSAEGNALFVFEIVNRPRLALRGEYGFVNTMPSGLLECNKSTAEIYALETVEGKVAIKNSAGQYWQITDTGVSAIGGAAEYYNIEFYQNSKCAIKSDAGAYFKSAQNGAFTANGGAVDKFTLFEY